MKKESTLTGLLAVALAIPGCTMAHHYRADKNYEVQAAATMAGASMKPVKKQSSRSMSPINKTSRHETPAARLMVYEAELHLIVENVENALNSLGASAKKAGGHVQHLDSTMIMVRIPAKFLDDYLKEIASLGVVTNKTLTGQDVTDTMHDLDIRLKTAVEMHARLLKLLDRAQKVEDMLTIEKEIQRIVGTIELIKGKRQALAHDVTYSAVKVHLNSPVPQKRINQEIPFSWVQSLANDMVSGRVSERWTSVKGDYVDFELPTGFALYHRSDYVTRAMSANEVLLKVRRHDNVEGADLAFWSKLAAKNLKIKRCMVIDDGASIEVYNGKKKGWMVQGVKMIGNKEKRYLLALAVTDKHVYTYEVWGNGKEVDTALEAIKSSIKSWRPGRLFE